MARRILVKGASGSGKSTLGGALARQLDLPYVELDALHHGPNWTAASSELLRERVLQRIDDDRGWVVDGNYDSKLGSLLIDRAELIVWLDLPLRTKLRRLAVRTTGRLFRKQVLWNGNRESLRAAFWGRDALFPWTVHCHFRSRREWPRLLAGRPLVRLKTAREVEDWLASSCARANAVAQRVR